MRLGVVLLTVALVWVHPCSGLGLPNIAEFFARLKGWDVSGSESEEVRVEGEDVLSRQKRQDPGIGDESQDIYLVRSSSIPTMKDKITPNTRYMPTLGNGHIGITVYDDVLFLNGVFNGAGSDSHRAEIPAIIMSRVRLANEELEHKATRKFILNARDGYFMETIDCDFAYIEHRLYVHQKYMRMFVSDIYARRKDHSMGGGIIYLTYPTLNDTSDFSFGQNRAHYSNWQVSGTTKTSEAGAGTQSVHMFWMDTLRQLSIRGSTDTINETMIMTVDTQESAARAEFDAGVQILGNTGGHYKLLEEHKQKWARIWAQGRVEVTGDTQIAKITTLSQFYILSSLPAPFPDQALQQSQWYNGVARTSVSKGSKGKDHQGHTYYDNELYILPAVLMFHPKTVKLAMRYRSALGPKAQQIAERMGSKGYKYPAQSAVTGEEVSPGGCQQCQDRKIYVSAIVAWMIRQYYSATRDRDYQINPEYNGCDVTREIARFLADKSTYSNYDARYNMNNITGPDENYPDIANNAFTMAASSLAIHWARYFACTCQRNERTEVPDEWIHKAMLLNLPYDNVKRLHYEFDGFEKVQNPRVSQADTIMMTYPLNFNMSHDIMRNDLEYYETLTDDRTPALTWSFYTIGWKTVRDPTKIESFFRKSYQDYVIQPFRVWTEYNEQDEADQDNGAVNFLPGMGGFLQSIVYGFAGLRIRPEMLEFHDPMPPIGCSKILLHGFKYLDNNMTIEIYQDKVTIQVHQTGDYPLILKRNDTQQIEENLPEGSQVTIEKPDNSRSYYGFYLFSQSSSGCEHPRDYIYMPWGYSPFIDGATDTRPQTVHIVVALVTSLLFYLRTLHT